MIEGIFSSSMMRGEEEEYEDTLRDPLFLLRSKLGENRW